MANQDRIIIVGKHGKQILGDLRVSTSKSAPLVIFCHGFKGFKDWGHFNLISDYIGKNVGHCFKFNFAFNGGTMEDPIDFPDLEAFGNNNYIKELDDIDSVLNAFFDGNINLPNWNKDVFLIGHSRGGGAVTLKAAEDSRVAKVVSLAGVGNHLTRLPGDKELEEWKRDGVYFIKNGRTQQDMPLYYQFLESTLLNKDRLDIEAACQRMNCPQLILHGTNDQSVSIDDAKNMHRLNPNSKLVVIEGADHVFGGKHPWKESLLPKHTLEALNEIKGFLIG